MSLDGPAQRVVDGIAIRGVPMTCLINPRPLVAGVFCETYMYSEGYSLRHVLIPYRPEFLFVKTSELEKTTSIATGMMSAIVCILESDTQRRMGAVERQKVVPIYDNHSNRKEKKGEHLLHLLRKRQPAEKERKRPA